MLIDDIALTQNSDCYCWPIERADIIAKINAQGAADNMADMLAERPHYFANTAVFLSPSIRAQMSAQIRAIEDVIKLPKFIKDVQNRHPQLTHIPKTKGAFMGYDFHITDEGPRLIEINSNAGGAFIVNMLEQSVGTSSGNFAKHIREMFTSEYARSERSQALKSIAIVDEAPSSQYHYPDMCLAKSLLQTQGFYVAVVAPEALTLKDSTLYYGNVQIDLVYNRLTDFDLSEPQNAVIKHAYESQAAVITPAPHHHALFADKRNLTLLSDQNRLAAYGASAAQRQILAAIPKTVLVTPDNADEMWQRRRRLFFKPQAGFGSRGAFRGAKLTKKVWGQILQGGYIAQDLITPPLRAVTVNGEKMTLKFDVRVYTYDGELLLLAARVYQGQTTNLRTAGGGLAPIIQIKPSQMCG